MKKYIYLQGNRILRYLPGAFCVILILLILLGTAWSVMVRQDSESEENFRFRIGVTGGVDDVYVKTALNAMGELDSMQYSLEMVYMTEEDARAQVKSGKLAAYIDIPDNFADEAFNGKLVPIKFVSKTGAAGLLSIFRDEITDVISDVFVETQKGVFGLYDAMTDQGVMENRIDRINELNIECIEYIFIRDDIYAATELGLSDSLSLPDYLLCGFVVLFLLLAALPFAPLMIRGESSLERMLSAKGRPLWAQTLCDFAVYAVALMTIVYAAVVVGGAAMAAFAPDMMQTLNVSAMLWRLLPTVLLTAALSYMMYTLSTDLIGGVLLQFFVTIALCFVSGCMYPVYFFPQGVQELAAWLPTGVARTMLSGAFTGQQDVTVIFLLVGYVAVFLSVGVWARLRHVRRGCA